MYNAIIGSLLERSKPCMVARFGANEIKATLIPRLPYLFQTPLLPFIEKRMQLQSGFYPSNAKSLKLFSNLMMQDIQEVDVLGSWRIEEKLLYTTLKKTIKVPLTSLEPYLSERPWSQALYQKKVLVIHPFTESIEHQYQNNRTKLFNDPRILPEFKSLITLKSVQSIANNPTEYSSWFEALDSMKAAVNKLDFDIAIIGCGAYGLPLAAHVKRLGKKAVHLGGATQMLFGIKGKRWIDDPKFNHIINEHFIYPLKKETPKDAQKVEGGCYW
jgi:hypothetical protein